MTDLNKERELEAQIEVFKKEAMELWFVPNLADTYKNKDLFSYSIMDGEVFFMREQARQLWSFWNKAKAQAVPETQSNDVLLNELHYFVDGQLYILENFDEHNKGFNKALKIVLKEIERIKKHGVSIREASESGAEG